MTTSLTEAFKKKFGPVPLLQSGQLTKATKIPNPENLNPKELEALRQMGKTLFQVRPTFVAVAYTQFPPKTFELFGADPSHTNIVLLSPNPDLFGILSGSLFINPQVRVSPRTTHFVNAEGCGSIDDARLDMFISRPATVTLDAHVYNPAKGYPKPTRVSNISHGQSASAIIEHESHHLDGQDATNYPVRLLDPWEDFQSPEWKGYSQDEWLGFARQVHTHTGKNFLVRRDDQLTVVDKDGKPLRNLR